MENHSEVLIMPGGAIKARGKEIKNGVEVGKIGGVLCRFSNKNETDWYGDFFDEETDFRFVEGMTCPVYLDHALNGLIGVRVFGLGILTRTREGIEIEAEMELTDDNAKALYERVVTGEMGWSSGTAGHLVKRTQVKTYEIHGESAWHIDHWPLGLDASLTASPAEAKNIATIKSIKSLAEARTLEARTLEARTAEARSIESRPLVIEAVKSTDIEEALDTIQREALSLQADLLLLSWHSV